VRTSDEQRTLDRHGNNDIAVDIDLAAGPDAIGEQQAWFVFATCADQKNPIRARPHFDIGQQPMQIGKRQIMQFGVVEKPRAG
jgi:hypothetical protein